MTKPKKKKIMLEINIDKKMITQMGKLSIAHYFAQLQTLTSITLSRSYSNIARKKNDIAQCIMMITKAICPQKEIKEEILCASNNVSN